MQSIMIKVIVVAAVFIVAWFGFADKIEPATIAMLGLSGLFMERRSD